MNEDRLIKLLNDAWKLVEPKPKYDDCNIGFPVLDIATLECLEKDNPTLGLATFCPFEEKKHSVREFKVDGLSWLSLIATITDELCGKRLAAIVEDDGTISGWQFAEYK